MDLMVNDPDGRIQLKIDILQFHESHEDFFTDENEEEKDNEKALRAFEQSLSPWADRRAHLPWTTVGPPPGSSKASAYRLPAVQAERTPSMRRRNVL